MQSARFLPVLLLTCGAASPSPPVPELGWMAGCWEEREGDLWTEECWTSSRGGMMLGSSRAGRGEEILEWETLRIQREAPNGDEGTVRLGYLASPGGRGWTLFAWSPSAGAGIAFFNLANDYPQRIRYWREGQDLIAEIALADGSKSKRWRYRRMRD